jgi:hypothetical protein
VGRHAEAPMQPRLRNYAFYVLRNYAST